MHGKVVAARALLASLTLAGLCALSCAEGPAPPTLPTSGFIQGKPKAGSSITHSQMC